MIKLEKFKEILKSIGAEEIFDEYDFCRSLILKKNDIVKNDITFIWHTNKCSAMIDNIEICIYNNLSIDGSWPNEFKINLNLLLGFRTVCVIPLKSY
jgi:hypothetical protein